MGIELNAVQSQKVSQSLIQQVSILQMSSPELAGYIEELALENPMAEIEEKRDEDREKEKLNQLEWLAEFDEQNRMYYQREKDDADSGDIFNIGADETDLLEDLLRMQIIGHSNSGEETEIIEYLIRCLDSRGYFTDSVEDIAVHFGRPAEKIRHCLNILQSFEPAGIGAGNLAECLMIQLLRLEQHQAYEIEKRIVENELELLGKNKLREIAKKLNVSVQRVNEAVSVIKSLNPKPANGYGHRGNIHYIKPDVTVELYPEGTKVRIEETSCPELRINESYMRLLRSGECSDEVGKYISGKVKQIEQVQYCISKRNDTLTKLVGFLVQHQKPFFEQGPGNLQPLKMQEMADEMAVHESTISRAVKGKYLQCAWGVFPMEHFFSKVQFANGNMETFTADQIKKRLKKLIDEENKKKPFSDQKLSEQMNGQGIPISRRTVAKYREEMGIGDCRERKNF